MKTVSPELLEHIQSGGTSLCYLWRVIVKTGLILGFSSHDRPLRYPPQGGVLYQSRAGFTASATKATTANSIDDVQIDGFMAEAGISQAQLEAGYFDGARVLVMLVNWDDLTMGHLVMRAGRLGDVNSSARKFQATLHSMTERLQNTIGRVETPGCDLEFGGGDKGDGEAYCGFDLAAATVNSEVTLAPDRANFFAAGLAAGSTPPPTGYYVNGSVTWLTGQNVDIEMEVKLYSETGAVELVMAMPYPIAVGDTFRIKPGCLKRKEEDCIPYGQILNFGGLDELPGTDAIMSVPEQADA